MSRLTPVSRQELIRRLRELGFEGPVPGRKHQHMDKGDFVLMLPNPHHGEKISVDLLTEIIRRAKITREEWFRTA